MRCKHCLAKYTPKRFLQKFCMENDECIDASIKHVLDKNRKLTDKLNYEKQN